MFVLVSQRVSGWVRGHWQIRWCPIHLCDEIQTELQDMENIGVIAKVTTPTECASSIVCSRKSSDKLRSCLDPKDLNEAIRRPHYKTPTLDEITHKLAGAKIFSKLESWGRGWHQDKAAYGLSSALVNSNNLL